MVDIAQAAHEASTVRKAKHVEAGALAAVLARAFEDDPAMRWVIKDDRRRLALLERGFDLYLRKLYLKQDECYTTASVAGAIVWELPGQWKVGVLDQLRLLPAMVRINGRLAPRIVRALYALEAGHPKEPHYYLPFIGVAPEWQGRGLGAALMRPILDSCDDDKVGAYLEASSPRNRALYERHDFEVTEEFRLGKGSPPLWRMWRAPKN
jgi:ribosomal protein S18 acetylase RimI-like enzyme